MVRILMIFIAGIYACNAAAIPRENESILLNAILAASSNVKPTWRSFKSIFLRGIQQEDGENSSGKETSNQVDAILQNSLSRNSGQRFGEENSKNVPSMETLIKTPETKNEHRNDSMNNSFNTSESIQDIASKDLDIGKHSVMANESIAEKQILEPLEMNKSNNSNNFTLNFTDYSADFFVVSEELNSIETLSVDENHLMSEGSEIALFQEMPTTGFEFLIDSETTRNMILTELFTSSLLMDESTDLLESLDFDSVITNLSLEENEIELNATTQEIFNATKDWYLLSEEAEGIDEFNVNVTDKNGLIANVELTDLPEESFSVNSDTIPVSFIENTEAELTLPVNATFNELQDLDELSEVEWESKNFTSNARDFDYKHTDLQSFIEDFSVFDTRTPSSNLDKNAEFDKAAQEPETLKLENGLGYLEEQNGENEMLNSNETNVRDNITSSSNFADGNESLSIALTQVDLEEIGSDELNIKIPVQETFSLNDSYTLLNADEKETKKLHSSITNSDWTSNKTELTDFEESLNSSVENLKLSLNENSTKLNITPVQETFSAHNNPNSFSEEPEKTRFAPSSSNFTNGSTLIGEMVGFEQESQDFISNTQSFEFNNSSEDPLSITISSEEMLNVTNAEVFYEAEVAGSFNINTTDIGNIVTELDLADFEECPTSIQEICSFHSEGNNGSKLDITSMPKTVNKEKNFDVFSEQMGMGNFSLNITDLPSRPTQPMEDTTMETWTCPSPGFCLLWLFARDSCTEDSHCHSTQKCCKLGCSNVCVDM